MTNAFLTWWLRGPRYRWSRLRRRLCERRYRKMELPEVTSLEDIEACLKQVKWTRDGFWHLYDSISYPQKVWASKKDDCDSFAILAAELLQRWNPDTNPVLVTAIVRPARKSHTVCAFSNGDGLSFFDNYRLRDDGYAEYKDVIDRFTRKADILVCWDVVDPTALHTLEFHRA